MNTTGKLFAHGVPFPSLADGGGTIGTAVGPLTGPLIGAAGAPGAEDAGIGDAHRGTVAKFVRPDRPGWSASSQGSLTPTDTMPRPGTTYRMTFRRRTPDGSGMRLGAPS